ncbi:uncharacterized protein [Spinacia oleracea]|uniref:RNase H type-1 domain-containing protein n=1 Tax=Spinacia oleracea TaxID=3562 RepID=A0ABM3QZE7_SPIOL|nr:uncharacterized protein LOC130463583 [Spinacia oleracea]
MEDQNSATEHQGQKRHNIIKEVAWSCPPPGFLKLNFDGAKRGSTSTSLGYVIRNEKGDLILAGAKASHPEGSALSYLQKLVHSEKASKVPWEINGLIEDSLADLSNTDNFVINHCYREANHAADFMAAKGSSCISMSLWFSSFDPSLSLIILKDALGYPFQRG